MKPYFSLALLVTLFISISNFAVASAVYSNAPNQTGRPLGRSSADNFSNSSTKQVIDSTTLKVTLGKVNIKQGLVLVNNELMHFDPLTVKVYRRSVLIDISAISEGLKARILLSAKDKTQRTISAFFI